MDPIVAPAPARVISPGRPARCRIRTTTPRVGARPFIPVVYPDGHTDELIIVETVAPGRNGVGRRWGDKRLAQVRGAKIDKPTWVFNGVGPMGFTCSAWNDAMDHLVAPGTMVDGAGVMRLVGREVQFWRDGVLRWAGPPITGRPQTDGTVAFACQDLGWYIARKFFGAAERKDQLKGIGSMDAPGLPGWVVTGCVKARDSVDKARGSASMVLSGSGVAQATFTMPARSVSPPIHLTVVAKVPAGSPPGTRVATITVRRTAGGAIESERHLVTDDSTPLGQWWRFSGYAGQDNGYAHHITVTLWQPGDHGATKFDDVRSLENNTTGETGKDLAVHGVAGINHIQTGYGQGIGFGFTPVVLQPTGVIETLGERHINHIQANDFFSRYTERADGWDWRIDPATREVQFAKRIGVDHTNLTLEPRLVQSGGWLHDETEISSKVVVPGDGDGVDRPEGGYTDTTNTAGLTLDYFHQPPANTPLSALDPIAEQVHQQKSQPQLSFDDLAISDRHLGEVNPGDRISGTMRIGKFRLPRETPVRLAQVSLDTEAGQLVLT